MFSDSFMDRILKKNLSILSVWSPVFGRCGATLFRIGERGWMDWRADRVLPMRRSCRLLVLLPLVVVASCAGSGGSLGEASCGGPSNEAALAEEQYEEMEREENR